MEGKILYDETKMKKPHALKLGDTIGIAASSSPFDIVEFKKGVTALENMGFRVIYRQDIFDKKHYLAGNDKRRMSELVEMLENPEVKALLFARGGYGMMRLLPYLEEHRFSTPPKIILGYSDVTTLLIYLYQRLDWVTFYGPVIRDLGVNTCEETKKSFLQAISQENPLNFQYPEAIPLKPGQAEGPLVGGCLSLVISSLGTPFEINTKNKILFLEDTNEKPYAVDRMLTQILLAKKLKDVKGIVFGSFANGNQPDHYQETIEDVLHDFKGPILFNFPAGHGKTKMTLPLGVPVRLDATAKKLEFLEGALT